MSLPNIITTGRVILVPVIFWLLVTGQSQLAFYAFLVAGISDAIDGYNAARESTYHDGGAAPTVAEALGAIAAYFYAAGAPSDDEGNVYNDLAFQQRGMLGNLCNNAKWMLENAIQHQRELFTKLDEIEATYDGGEIANRNMTRVLDQLERCKTTQIPACEEWFAVTKAAYAGIVGEEWKPFAKQGKPAVKQDADAIRARIAALRG